MIGDRLERELASAGLCAACALTDGSLAFFSDATVQRAARYSTEAATASAELASRLRHVLGASRLAHAMRIMARDRVGGYAEADELATELRSWVSRFVAEEDHPRPDVRAQRPYREASVTVAPGSGPGDFRSVFRLRPHAEIDGVVGWIELTTNVGAGT